MAAEQNLDNNLTGNPQASSKPDYRRGFLIGMGGYILAGIIANLVTLLIFASGLLTLLLRLVPAGQPLVRIIAGVMLAAVGLGLGGAVGGLARGYFLQRVDYLGSRKRYLWSSAFAGGVAHGLLSLPILLLISLVSIYNVGSEKDPLSFVYLFALIGALYGLVNGLILALLTTRIRYAWLPWLAAIVGSLAGGALAGLLFWQPEMIAGRFTRGASLLIFLTLTGVALNAIAGGLIGLAYAWIGQRRNRQGSPAVDPRRWQVVVTVSAASLLLLAMASFTNQIAEFVTIYPGSVTTSLSSETQGVGWRAAEIVAMQPAGSNDLTTGIAAVSEGLAQVWSGASGETSDIFIDFQVSGPEGLGWEAPINISNTPQAGSIQPQAAAGADGSVVVVWAEAGSILLSRCDPDSCTAPVDLSAQVEGCTTGTAVQREWPVINAVSGESLAAAWSAGPEQIEYALIDDSGAAEVLESGCLHAGGLPAPQSRLAAAEDGRLVMAAASGAGEAAGPILLSAYQDGVWTPFEQVGSGSGVEVAVSPNADAHLAWCDADGKIAYLPIGGSLQYLPFRRCAGRPVIAYDHIGNLRIIYVTQVLEDNFGAERDIPGLVETILGESGWTTPVLVSTVTTPVQPSAAFAPDGSLELAWAESSGGSAVIKHAHLPVYTCDESQLIGPVAEMISAIENGGYHPAGYRSPFCGNRYEGMVFMPTPLYEPILLPDKEDTGYDQVVPMITEARQEVLISNMQWDPDEGGLSPGYRLAEGVAELYRRVKAHPEDYPRGMTVRILLGNYPNLATFEYGDQIWGLLNALAAAGVDTMEDPAIGWKVETANYAGSYPHSHTKFMVVDGKVLLAAGFNISWYHLPEDDPSGKGDDLTDLGIVIAGPVAQTGVAVFDDEWGGANQLICSELSPDGVDPSKCTWKTAEGAHLPEILRFYIADVDETALGIYRTADYKEADAAYTAALEAATTSIDGMHVNFSADLICLVNLIVPDVCTFENALPYMQSILSAVENNGAYARIIVENGNMNGLENRVGYEILRDELERRGLSNRVEVRFFNGRLHSKSVLIDDELLIIGSQNFHYSSFSEGGLLEFSMATTARLPVETYRDMFEDHWLQAIPYDEAEWGTSD